MPADRQAVLWPLSIGLALLTSVFLVDWIAHGDVSSLHLWLSAIAVAGLIGTWAPPTRFSRIAFRAALVGAVASLTLGCFLLWSGQAVDEGWRATWVDIVTAALILVTLGWSSVRNRGAAQPGGGQ
jgi:hypothetical protein